MAALEVVHGRLDRLGLTPSAWSFTAARPTRRLSSRDQSHAQTRTAQVNGSTEQVEALGQARELLNRHASLMNTPLEPAGVTVFQVIGRLAGLNERVSEPIDFELVDSTKWTKTEFSTKRRGLEDLQIHLKEDRPSERSSLVGGDA